MIVNYFKTALRSILKHKGFSIINIVGLAIGLAVFSLTADLFKFQLSFNRFHEDADRIYSIVQVLPSGTSDDRHTVRTRAPLRNLLLEAFPEIEDATRWIPTDRIVVRQRKNKFFAEEGTFWLVDPNLLTFFSFEMLAGDAETALLKPKSAVLTESVARRFFGTTNVLGRKLTIGKELELEIQGVTRDIPLNSSLKYDVLVSLNSFDFETNWNVKGATFVRLSKTAQPTDLEQKFPAFIQNNLPEPAESPKELYLLPLKDINMKTSGIRTYWTKEIPQIVYLTFAIGIVMLLAVCFNFMNLATAGHFMRAKEVGVRKVIGASRRQLVGQFLAESVLLSILAFPVAIVLKEIMLPLFVYLVSSGLSTAADEIWSDPWMTAALLAVTLLAGIAAGIYPSLLLSRLDAVKILREHLRRSKKGVFARRMLIVLQLITAIFSVLVALVSFNQYNYLLQFDVGYKRQGVLVVPLGTNYTNNRLRPLKEDLRRHPAIEAVSTAMWIPTSWGTERRVEAEGTDEKESWMMNAYGIDYGFIELLGMEVVQGRSFARKFGDIGRYIINQTAVEKLNWDHPIGKKLTIRGQTGVVVGIVKDFHFKDLLEEIYPTVLFLEPNYLNYLYIKLADAPMSRVLNHLENSWRRFSPDIPLEYSMLTDHYHKDLLGIKKWGGLAGLISSFIILFSCLGLFGLASYTTRSRTKEIGIRKAHGASMANIMKLILREFLKLILFAMAVTWPLFYFIDRVLVPDIFAYSAKTGLALYFIAGGLALITGLLAVLFQTIKAAKANPIDSLRYE
ncbi:MAG: ABC transporter permease [Desulfobacterales bacterium]|jgi:putative ABC transport system permease protein